MGAYVTINPTPSGDITGSGTTNTIAMFTSANTIGNSSITQATGGFLTFTSSGTPASGEPNYFLTTINTITGNQYNIRATYTVNSSGNNSSYRIGGVLGETYIHASNTGQLGFAVGTYGYIQNYGSGVITRAIGSYNIVANRGSGNITNTYGVYAKTENDSTGVISVNAGVFIGTPTNSGTIITNYGIYVEAQSGIGTTNYALYLSGASDNSYIAGNLTVNTSLTSTTVVNTPSIIGTTTSGISYKSTTGTGAATDAAHLFVGGTNGATESIRFLNNGNIRIPNARVIQGMDSAGTYRNLFNWSGGDNILINGRPGTTDIEINPTSASRGTVIKSTGQVGIYGVSSPTANLHVGASTSAGASGAPFKINSGTVITTPESGAIEYDGSYYMTQSDATRRFCVLATNATKTIAGAPYANDGYITIRIGGTDVKLMTTA